MKEFFGFGGYTREPEGFLSWQHLLFVTCLMVIMVSLAIFLGKKTRLKDDKAKNRVLIWTAISIDTIELFKIIMVCIRAEDPMRWLYDLPLFLCSIQLIAIPVAAFTKGRIKAAALDFVLIFGILGAVLGTYGAGNIYGSTPVLSFDTMVSGVTHTISGFASLYIAISGMLSMKKQNIPLTASILLAFCAMAYIANKLIDYNYMFLVRGDGTPYDVLYNLVGGNQVLYPIGVILMFFMYILAFYGIYFSIQKKKAKQ